MSQYGGVPLTPTGEQYGDWAKVQRIMNSLKPPRAGNPRILAIDQAPLTRAKTGGFPKPLYHATMEPVLCMREDQEEELAKLGYVDHYIPREYPRTLFRRNMDPKFDERPERGTGVPMNNAFVEELVVNDPEHEQKIRNRKHLGKYWVGAWVTKLDDLDPIPEGPLESPDVTIARLEGQVQGLERGKTPREPKKRAARKRKAASDAVLSPVA